MIYNNQRLGVAPQHAIWWATASVLAVAQVAHHPSRVERDRKKGKKVKPPQYLPLDVLAVEFSVKNLSFEQRGAYEALRHLQWLTPSCSLPNDHEWIMRKLGVKLDLYEALFLPLLDEFFDVNGKNRLHDESITERLEWVRSKSRAGEVGSKARWNKEKEVCDRNAGRNGKEKKGKERKRKEKKDNSVSPNGDTGADAPDPRKLIYDLGKQILGESAGGQITRICKQEGGDMGRALSVLLKAQSAANPSEWVAGYLKYGEKGNGQTGGWVGVFDKLRVEQGRGDE